MAKKNYDIVEVMWSDAEEKGDVGWNDIKEMMRYAKKACPTMKSVGYQVYKDDDHISLLSTLGPDECSTIEKIPVAFIKSITTLSPVTLSDPGTTPDRSTTVQK
jgi:hypothetical protein